MLKKYTGNCPKIVNKDAKYRIIKEDGEFVVGIEYRTPFGETWAPTSKQHPELIDMVNAVKIEAQNLPGGQFYINEYKQVIVPTQGGYFYAGEYQDYLLFSFEGKIISGNGEDFDGNHLLPGKIWSGVHTGIPYILNAGGQDISFEVQLRPKVKLKKQLSNETSLPEAAKLANRLCGVIGNFDGGRFYINEFRQMFKPVKDVNGVKYIYLGKLEKDDPWFPKWRPDEKVDKPKKTIKNKKVNSINLSKPPVDHLKKSENISDIFKLLGI